MIEQGSYYGVLTEAKVVETKDGTGLQMALRIGIDQFWDVRLQKEDKWFPIKAEVRDIYLSLHDNAWEISRKQLESIGFNGDFEDPRFDSSVYAGLIVECIHDTYQNKTREKWRLPQGPRTLESASTDKLKVLKAKWKATGDGPPAKPTGRPMPPPAKAAATGGAPAPVVSVPAGTATGAPGPSDDDVPF